MSGVWRLEPVSPCHGVCTARTASLLLMPLSPLFSEMPLARVALSGCCIGMSRIAILTDLKSVLFPVTLEGLFLLVTTGKGRTPGTPPGPTGALECGSHLEPVQLGLVRVAPGTEPRAELLHL